MSILSKNIKTIVYSDKKIIYFRNIRNTSCSRSKMTTKRIKNDIFLMLCYSSMLFKGYQKIFILTRILGTIKRNFKLIRIKR